MRQPLVVEKKSNTCLTGILIGIGALFLIACAPLISEDYVYGIVFGSVGIAIIVSGSVSCCATHPVKLELSWQNGTCTVNGCDRPSDLPRGAVIDSFYFYLNDVVLVNNTPSISYRRRRLRNYNVKYDIVFHLRSGTQFKVNLNASESVLMDISQYIADYKASHQNFVRTPSQIFVHAPQIITPQQRTPSQLQQSSSQQYFQYHPFTDQYSFAAEPAPQSQSNDLYQPSHDILNVGYQSQQQAPLTYLPQEPQPSIPFPKEMSVPNFHDQKMPPQQHQIILPSAPPLDDERE
ncbi:MAG: hypothetical protein EZS28_028467 [Streblomastix strix]|uniref:Uncharacterized protein n=1 Tax=Streblomastix strix TaxID=222440 RepID=A0A5J4V1P7_9EUKA|nr:MAG: hypothetical protein EZS28_028467 [Streblomastix strix]